MDFISIIKSMRQPVLAELNRWLPDKEPRQHYAMIRDYPSRTGKLLRPALVLLTCEAFGGDKQKAIRTAAALEVAHAWILIHDDIQDNSELRRGKPCLHRIWGEELALNAGDALHLIMWRMLAANREILGPELTFRIIDEVYDILMATAEGQFLDVSWVRDRKLELTEADYFNLIDRKSGLYTIAGPMRLGALIAGANEQQLAVLSDLGTPLGRAFQIQDDILNLTAAEKYGKEIAGDITEGKRTLILLHLLRHCSVDEKRTITDIYFKPRETKSQAEIALILELIKRYRSIEYAKSRAQEFAEQAKNIFDTRFNLPDTPAKKALRAAIEFVVRREL